MNKSCQARTYSLDVSFCFINTNPQTKLTKDSPLESKRDPQNIGIADIWRSHYLWSLETTFEDSSPPRLTYRLGLNGYDCGSLMAETLLWCCAVRIYQKYVFWNLLEIHPPGCQGKLFMRRCLASGTLLQNPPKAGTRETADPGCCRRPRAVRTWRWRSFPLLHEFEVGEAVCTAGA